MRLLVISVTFVICLVAVEVPRNELAANPPDDAAAPQAPARPRRTVDVSELRRTGRRIPVPAEGDLQRALDEARPGDEIVLEAGAIYHGPFQLPKKEGAGWIHITSSGLENLPTAGQRVHPSDSPHMPKLRAPPPSVIVAAAGAHHYRFVGIDVAPDEGAAIVNLVQLGTHESDPGDLPHHIIIDRSFLHGDNRVGTRRGLAMNGRDTAVINSYLANFKDDTADSQSIAGWNGDGPFVIANNYLEAAGENVMFGGADPAIPDLVPADIEISENHFAKPLRWRPGLIEFEGARWSVKNLLELKNARRVHIEGNLFEHNWPDSQNGFAILFTVRNQDGKAPWSVVEDVVFANNVVRRVGSGINILGHDDNHTSQQTSRIALRNNLFVDVGGTWGSGRLFQLLDRTRDITIDHNTALQSGTLLTADGGPHTGFVFENNIALHNEYGIHGSGAGSGLPALEKFFPRFVVRRNVLIGADANKYPSDNFFPKQLSDIAVVSLSDEAYRVSLAAPYARTATDGSDPGADMASLAQVLSRAPSPPWQVHESVVRSVTGAHDPFQFTDGEGEFSIAAMVLWTALFALVYVYIGYPFIAWLSATLRPARHVRAPVQPRVTVIVVAHNEADRIEARIENLLALVYPRDRLQIIIGSDGSSDGTVQRAQRFAGEGVTVIAYPTRRGKAAVLNELVPIASGDIVILADARQRFSSNVAQVLVSHFADPTVGAVSGELVIMTDDVATSAAEGTGFYWKYEKFIRLQESRTRSSVGASGSIYAIRRSLFEPVAPDTVLDDVVIPMRIVRRGYAVLFEPEAKAYDRASHTARQEFVRKVRTIAGTFQLLAREKWLWNPARNPLWLETISHKALRLTIPLLHAALLIANLVLIGEGSFYQILMGAQVMFAAAGVTGHLFRWAPWRPLIIAVPYAMCLMSWATVVGFVRFATHRQHAAWDPAYPRPVAKVSVKFSNDAITGQVLTTYSTALEQRRHPGDRPQHSSSR
jgi:cellulose synthase/poly-beta-1,6-N-acetylglucosamine synthase-like glycosyltransferase